MGGSTNSYSPGNASTLTTRVNLQGGRVERIQKLPTATIYPAVVTAPNSIAVCGGGSTGTHAIPNCQVYFLSTATYANVSINLI